MGSCPVFFITFFVDTVLRKGLLHQNVPTVFFSFPRMLLIWEISHFAPPVGFGTAFPSKLSLIILKLAPCRY